MKKRAQEEASKPGLSVSADPVLGGGDSELESDIGSKGDNESESERDRPVQREMPDAEAHARREAEENVAVLGKDGRRVRKAKKKRFEEEPADEIDAGDNIADLEAEALAAIG